MKEADPPAVMVAKKSLPLFIVQILFSHNLLKFLIVHFRTNLGGTLFTPDNTQVGLEFLSDVFFANSIPTPSQRLSRE